MSVLHPAIGPRRAFHKRLLRELQRTPGGLDGLEIYYDKDGIPRAKGGKVFGRPTLQIINPKPKPKKQEITMNAFTEVTEYKGNPVLTIKKTFDDRFPFSFGLGKARLILENIDAIRAFVAESDKKSKAA